ncbi:hypothetical protein [Nocardioides sp. SYSU D00038]|uniref:hypothetical protein n=1 Tax=Nocardioides sp. SYSU D00038 TaxID=2812554 RepID=UPI00196821BC|nr:hypothetical protein [Nocardioides sp. SYSU D00038]
MSHNSLDDLLVQVPDHVRPDVGAAWSTGRRRVRRRRLTGVAAATAAVVLAATLVTTWHQDRSIEPAPSPDGRPSVDGYPVRVGPQLWERELPARPGPVAGFVMSEPVDDDLEKLHVVSKSGRTWFVPRGERHVDFMPALSDDGTRLGYQAGPDEYVVRDLVTGAVVSYPVSDNLGDDARQPFMTQGQIPAWWSRDGRQLVLSAWRLTHPEDSFVVLDLEGGVRPLPAPDLSGNVVGWTPDGAIAWLIDGTSRREALLVLTDDRGAELDRMPLTVPDGYRLELHQWNGSLSPAGTRVVLLAQGPGLEETGFVFDLASGEIVASGDASDRASLCTASWIGEAPLFAVSERDDPEDADPGAGLVSLAGEAVSVVEPGLDPHCFHLTPGALAGNRTAGPSTWLFGTATGWLSWNWAYVLTATGLLVLAVLTALRVRQRRAAASRAKDSTRAQS